MRKEFMSCDNSEWERKQMACGCRGILHLFVGVNHWEQKYLWYGTVQ